MAVVIGALLIALGVLFGLKELGVLQADISLDGWWTLFLIVPGAVGIFTSHDKIGNIIVTPFYAHMTTAQVVALIVPALLPFNALKFTIHGVVTFLIYKPISNLLNR